LIPAYNAQDSLKELIQRIRSLAAQPQDVLIVNDGSDDQTSQIARDAKVSVIDADTNQGKGKALRTGFEHYIGQKYEGYIVCLDADLQHPPEKITDFLKFAQKSNCKFVIGNRSKKIGVMPFHRILSNKITSLIISVICRQKIEDSQCGFRLIHTEVLKDLDLEESGFQMESEMILKAAGQGIKIGFVPIPVIYNSHGSQIGNVRDTVMFVWVVLKYIFGNNKDKGNKAQRHRGTE
jgi:glycosyltransferase involved in cell wall biosynthesis